MSTIATSQSSPLVLESVQWSTLDHVDEIEPINEKDLAILEEIRGVIDRHGYHNRFGVALLHKHFEVHAGEVALEETDEEARISTVRVVEDNGEDANRIGTMWRFKQDSLGPVSVTVCERQCDYNRGHKNVHVKVGR
ncbi:MAG: hypothetical protein AAGC60_09615 [Acidobacteriota bacterium]